jgi:hypothetical protein
VKLLIERVEFKEKIQYKEVNEKLKLKKSERNMSWLGNKYECYDKNDYDDDESMFKLMKCDPSNLQFFSMEVYSGVFFHHSFIFLRQNAK